MKRQSARTTPGVDGFGESGTIAWFVILAYGFSWAWWIPLAISPTIVDPGQGWPTHLLGLMGPALAAIVVIGFSEGRAGLRDLWSRIVRWRVGWVWYGVIAATAALAVTPLITESDLNAADFVLYSGAPSAGFTVVLYVFVVNGLGEEIGWRGFLADRLLLRTSQARTALIVWPIWGLWHLPLFWVVANFREFGVGGTIGWAIGLGFGSVVLTWLYQSAGRSILIVALWHTAYNFTTATEATGGIAAAVATAAVIAASVIIMRRSSTWESPATGAGSVLNRP